MKKLVLLAATVVISLSSMGQDSYTETLKEYFKAAGQAETFNSVIDQVIGMYKQQMPTVDAATWDMMSKEFKGSSMDELSVLLADVYKKHLTEKDLKEIIAFYNTPVGKKLAAETPAITNESMAVGQAWGAQIGQKVAQKAQQASGQ